MDLASELLGRIDVSSAHKEELRRRLNVSVASFAAAATSLLQGRDSATTTAQQLRELMSLVMAPDSQWKQRDTERVAEVVSFYRKNPGKLAVACEDKDTRLWLARALQVALDFDHRPAHGVYAVRANPAPSEAGDIIVVDPDDTLLKEYPRVLVF